MWGLVVQVPNSLLHQVVLSKLHLNFLVFYLQEKTLKLLSVWLSTRETLKNSHQVFLSKLHSKLTKMDRWGCFKMNNNSLNRVDMNEISQSILEQGDKYDVQGFLTLKLVRWSINFLRMIPCLVNALRDLYLIAWMNSVPLVVVGKPLMLYQTTLRLKIFPLGVDTSSWCRHFQCVDTLFHRCRHFKPSILSLKLSPGANLGVDTCSSENLSLATDF